VDHYIAECERYENTLKIFILIFEVIESYRKAKELYAKNREESLKLLDRILTMVNDALELQESMIAEYRKNKVALSLASDFERLELYEGISRRPSR